MATPRSQPANSNRSRGARSVSVPVESHTAKSASQKPSPQAPLAVKRAVVFYETKLADSTGRDELVGRWTAPLLEAVKRSLVEGTRFPATLGVIEVEFAGKPAKLLDLRGIGLSRTELNDADLSYCALDWADLSGAKLRGVHLQYSRLCGANLQGIELERLQASPVDATGANFSDAMVTDSFFQGSTFRGAKVSFLTRFIDCTLSNTVGLPGSAITTTHARQTADRAAVGIARTLIGRVVSDKRTKTVTVLVERRTTHELYGKIVARSTKYHAHDEKNACRIGDTVEIAEGRPISKTKSWVVTRLIGKAKLV